MISFLRDQVNKIIVTLDLELSSLFLIENRNDILDLIIHAYDHAQFGLED